MRNNGKKLVRLLVAALLALAMTLSLTACQVEIPGMGTINISDGTTTGGTGGGNTGGDIGGEPDRKSTRLNSSHSGQSRMPSSA